MVAGNGADTFYADWSAASTAIVWENDPAKTVTVQGAELSGLERLLVATGSGDDVIRNTKVTANDYIDTGAGNNTIDAGGGSDTMVGGLGNDFYAVDSSGDVVTELASEGIDTVQSTISTFTPANATTAVAIGSNILLTFNEPIQKGTGTIAIHSGSATGPVVDSYDAATSSSLTISGSRLTINPTADLDSGTHYFVTLCEGTVKDLAGNSYAGTDTYDFTTASTFSAYNLHGSATFWKTGAAIADVISTFSSAPAATGTQPVEFRNIHVAADGTRSIEIWETSTKSDIKSVHPGLSLPTGSAATWQEATAFSSGWSRLDNKDKPGEFILEGLGTTALSSGSVKLGTLTLTAPTHPQHFELSLSAAQLGNDTVPPVGLSSDSMTTGTDGLYQQHNMTVGTYIMSSAKGMNPECILKSLWSGYMQSL